MDEMTSMDLKWKEALAPEFEKQYFKNLSNFIIEERSQCVPVYPPSDQVFSWTHACKLDNVKVVIVGQDPYHKPKQAHGLAYSLSREEEESYSPSLTSIYKELQNEYKKYDTTGLLNNSHLMDLAQQGLMYRSSVDLQLPPETCFNISCHLAESISKGMARSLPIGFLRLNCQALYQDIRPIFMYRPPLQGTSRVAGVYHANAHITVIGSAEYSTTPGQIPSLAHSLKSTDPSLHYVYTDLMNIILGIKGPIDSCLTDWVQRGLETKLPSNYFISPTHVVQSMYNGQLSGWAQEGKHIISPTDIQSLHNTCTEIQNTIDGFKLPNHGHLLGWARQGVLLLNTVLTVREGAPKSHECKGWEHFTDAVISYLNVEKTGLVFMLWGECAKRKEVLIDNEKHCVLKATHPSPQSAYQGDSFIGCNHFLRCNKYLVCPYTISRNNETVSKKTETPIQWTDLSY